MEELAKSILYGFVVLICARGLLHLVKKADKAHGLPKQVSRKAYCLFFLAGCSVPTDSILTILSGTVVLAYLCFVAYTDHYTGLVYCYFSYAAGTVGFLLLLLQNRTVCPALVLLVYCGIVIALTLFRAWSIGDAEILIATAPFLILSNRMPVYILAGFIFITVVYFLLYALVIRGAGLHGRSAMAPAIAAAAASVLWLVH